MYIYWTSLTDKNFALVDFRVIGKLFLRFVRNVGFLGALHVLGAGQIGKSRLRCLIDLLGQLALMVFALVLIGLLVLQALALFSDVLEAVAYACLLLEDD